MSVARRGETRDEHKGVSAKEKARRRETTKDRRAQRDPKRFGKVNWDVFHHEQLFDMIHRANPGQMYTRAAEWNELARGIQATTAEVTRVMGNAMTAWRGQAAVGAAESSTRLLRSVDQATVTASTIAQNLSVYTEAVEWAQRNMPEPAYATAERNFRDGYTVTGTGGPSTAVLVKQLLSDGIVSHEEGRARKAEAVAVMSEYEARSKDVHDNTPEFEPVQSGIGDSSQPWAAGPDSTPPRGERTPTTPAVPPGTGVGVGAGGGTTSAAGFVTPTGLPGGGTTSGGPGGPGGGLGGAFGGGLGSLGSGGSDVVRNMPGAGGFGGVGPVPGRGPVGPGGMAAAGGARGAGGPGAFGGLPFGGAQGEEEKTHKNKYDEGIDFFDDLPPAYPSVFGA